MVHKHADNGKRSHKKKTTNGKNNRATRENKRQCARHNDTTTTATHTLTREWRSIDKKENGKWSVFIIVALRFSFAVVHYMCEVWFKCIICQTDGAMKTTNAGERKTPNCDSHEHFAEQQQTCDKNWERARSHIALHCQKSQNVCARVLELETRQKKKYVEMKEKKKDNGNERRAKRQIVNVNLWRCCHTVLDARSAFTTSLSVNCEGRWHIYTLILIAIARKRLHGARDDERNLRECVRERERKKDCLVIRFQALVHIKLNCIYFRIVCIDIYILSFCIQLGTKSSRCLASVSETMGKTKPSTRHCNRQTNNNSNCIKKTITARH